jgi:tetraprenyl-beta-curcumene synthase
MSHAIAVNPTPLSADQVRALLTAASRELSWGLPEVSREVKRWRRLAEAIPDGPLRVDALHAIRHKRGHADGAALFSVLPDDRNGALLRMLVGYEAILDFLDNVSERHPTEVNGRELHMALIDAVDPDRPMSDYYRHHPWDDDGGYLAALVESCRAASRSLPSYDCVRELVVREARRAQVLALNHLTDPVERDRALRDWAATEYPGERHLTWFELSGAASASVVVLALLALAADPYITDADVQSTYAAYWPWVSLVGVMLDSYADEAEDADLGNHSYVAHYSHRRSAVHRLQQCVSRASEQALKLPNGHRHAVIVSCMVALYLSKDSARTPCARDTTRRIVRAGGSLTRLLLPILRTWRFAYSQSSS